MNKVVLMGRLTRDPEVRYFNEEQPTAHARYTLAVNRRYSGKNKEQAADFINCAAFGRNGEFAEKYFRKGMRVAVSGRIQTGSYTNREGRKVYTTEIIIEEQEFAESKPANQNSASSGAVSEVQTDENGFMNIPDGIDEELPFN